MNLLDWQSEFRLGLTIRMPVTPTVQAYKRDSIIRFEDICESFKDIVLNKYLYVAPKNFDIGMETIKRRGWKYYTIKRLPGAIVFLGN